MGKAAPSPISTLQAPPALSEGGAAIGKQMPDMALWEELLEPVPVGEPRQPSVSGQSAKVVEHLEPRLLESPSKAAGPQQGQGQTPTAAGLTAPDIDVWDELLKPIDAHQVPW